MALNQKERELVLWGRENGKNSSEIVQALGKYRQQQATPTGKTGVAGFAVGAAKELGSAGKFISESPLNPLAPIHKKVNEKLGITDEALEPKSEAERTGSKAFIVGELATGGSGLIKGAFKKFLGGGTTMFKNKTDELTQAIAPKTTGKQGEKLAEQGRVIKGRENALTGKAKDVIIPDDKMKRATASIEKNIPEYNAKDSFALANDIKVLTTKQAETLKPQLQVVKTTDEGRSFLIDEWEKLKKVQKGSDLWDDAPTSNVNFQNKFQKFVDEALEADNLDDLWDIRKRYDSTIGKNIKNPSPSAGSSIQTKNEMWLQNRSILNDIIEGTSEQLDDIVRNNFDDMSALYTARQNLISKARIDLKGKEGLINKRNALKYALGGTIGTVVGAQAF